MELKLNFVAATPAGPLVIDVPEGAFGSATVVSGRDSESGESFTGQVAGDKLYLIMPAQQAGRRLQLDMAGVAGPVESPLTVEQAADSVSVSLRGEPFGVFRFGAGLARPIVWPVVGPEGQPLTRGWPMSEDEPDESRDHPHHQSLWVAHGDVNGADHWSIQKGHGVQRVKEMSVAHGPACVTVDTTIDWVTSAGQRQLSEQRRTVFWALAADCRIIDLAIRFDMTNGPVTFGDTKEGGLCSVRVASSMEEKRGGGVITNSQGGRTEANCWGKAAPWCDYSGPVGGRAAGIAILDRPGNFAYPMTWHVRAYGLMAANPFGLSAFTGNENVDGSHTWQADETVELFYRVVLHAGDAEAANIPGQWLLFAEGPKVKVVA